MEGQQPVAGDLSEEAPPEGAIPGEGPTDETASDENASVEDPSEAGPAAPTWLRRNSRRLALLSSVGLFVAAGAFAGATAQAYLMDRAAVALKEKVARTASEAITTLWSYTPEDMDTLPDRSSTI